ncbi:TolC family outer membrane protein [Ideonella sp. BN130291]|uniref:TolC family outer membrane protein n=1 Tax=Ideonella sp. BN130291 TaxID=3112940 RepID=UPI002E25D17D|nr:TolC family outer membrane protein [Ideonella sp. BN130291]
MSLKRSRVLSARLLPLALALTLGGLQTTVQAEDLVELYNAARAFDATYLSVRAQAESAEFAAERSKAALRPNINGTASAGRTESFDTAKTVAPGVTTPDRLNTNSTAVTISGSQALFNRAASVTIEQADRRREQARIALDAAEQDLIVRVSQAYFDVLGAQDALTTARANRTAITEQLASAKRNFEVGTATITDTREAQARFDLATAQEIVADNDLRTKRIALDQLVGRSNVTPKPLAVPAVLPAVVPNDPEQWVGMASASNPAIRRSTLDVEVARLETDKARAGHLPTVALVANAGTNHAWGSAPNIQNSAGTTKNATLGLQLNVPIFSGFSVQNQVKESLSLEEKARQDLEAARRDAAQRTRTVYFGVQSGIAQVKALEAAESSSKLALEATQLGYKVGVRVNLDVLNAQNQLFVTQRDLAKARYDVLMRELQLRQAAGTLTPGDLGAVNQLLAK